MYAVVNRLRRLSDRAVLRVLGVIFTLISVAGMLSSGLFWRNYWGGLVFGPLMLAIGLGLLFGASRFPESFSGRRPGPNKQKQRSRAREGHGKS